MRTLACKDLRLSHCDFVAHGETIHEVMEEMIEHIEDKHLHEWGDFEKKLDMQHERDFLVKHIKDDDRSPV